MDNHQAGQIDTTSESTSSSDGVVAMETDGSADVPAAPFIELEPHPLANMDLIDEVDSLSPIIDIKVAELFKEDTPQIYALCGRGADSSLKILRHGLAVGELAVSPLPGIPNGVWTVKQLGGDAHHAFIVVSFSNLTLTLAVGAQVKETKDAGFLLSTSTLHCSLVGDDSMMQVHPNGIRVLQGRGRERRIYDWEVPGRRQVVKATANRRQVVIALSGGELVYFELDAAGQLAEVDRRDIGREVVSLDIPPLDESRLRVPFVAVGDRDNTVRLLSLSTDRMLQKLAVLALPAAPESLCFVAMSNQLFLNIGLRNGVLWRTVVDPATGDLSDTRQRFLGSEPVRLARVAAHGEAAVLATSSRTWLGYMWHARFHLTPLIYRGAFQYAAPFAFEQCPEGLVGTHGGDLCVVYVDRFGGTFHVDSIPLAYTPRRCIIYPNTDVFVIAETDHNSLTIRQRDEWRARWASRSMQVDGDEPRPMREVFPKPGKGKWASLLRVLDVRERRTLDLVEMPDNEAIITMTTCVFHDREGETFLVVGSAKDMTLQPRRCAGGNIRVYKLVEGRTLSLVHETPIDDAPTAMCAFQGRLLVGVGRVLRLYDLGKKKLLRKCENKSFPNMIVSLHVTGERIVVGDVTESFMFAKYKRSENQFYVFADTTVPRWLTSSVQLDYDTLAGTDKFGNVFVTRLPAQVSEEIDDDPTGNRLKWEQGYLNGAPYKCEELINYHIGEVATCITKATLLPGGAEVLLYGTVYGALGVLMPFTTKEDVDFFSHLEMHMRQQNTSLVGRDHLSFRSYYFPVKDTIDGDLCEQYSMLDPEVMRSVAGELDRKVPEVLKKLEDTRNRIM